MPVKKKPAKKNANKPAKKPAKKPKTLIGKIASKKTIVGKLKTLLNNI
jgi:hypothetical protein